MSKMILPFKLSQRDLDFCGAVPCPGGTEGPRVHFEWNEPYDFPDKGEMSLKFRVYRREESINDDGRKHFEVSVELSEITEMKEESSTPARNFDEAAKALDKLREKAEKDT